MKNTRSISYIREKYYQFDKNSEKLIYKYVCHKHLSRAERKKLSDDNIDWPHWGLTLLKEAFIKETAEKISIDEDAVNDLRIGSIPFLFPVFFCRFVCDKNAEIVQNQAGIDFLCILSGFDLNNAKLQEIKMTVGILCVDCRKCEVMQIDQMAS